MEISKNIRNLASVLLLTQFTPSVVKAEYVLPESDYRPSSVSQPCVSGEIGSIGPSFIFVKSNNKNIKVRIVSDTSIFTVYGGYISKKQLKPHQKLKVWYKGKSCKKPEVPLIAARVIIASESPNDDWPK